MVYIDYFGGTHGQFLEFLIAKHIFRLPEYENWVPFKDLGVSHLKPMLPWEYVCADHFTYFPFSGIKIKDDPNNLLINIRSEYEHLQDIFVFNAWQRAGELPVNFFDIDSVLTKIKPEFQVENSRSFVRNIIYSQIREESFIDTSNNFNKHNIPLIIVKFHNFYVYDAFLLELEKIANATTGVLIKNNLEQEWQMFMELNTGYHLKLKLDKIFSCILEDKDISINLDIYEEANINSRITKLFNIHNDIGVFENDYPTNTFLIAKDIKQVMKNRNPEFSLDLPIRQQLDKITLEF
jgi:hypothetical protein